MNDKVSVRFYYNLGIEYFKLLKQIGGHGQMMAMMDGESCVRGFNFSDQQTNNIEQNQLVADMQQINFESYESEIQSPSKVI